MPLNLETQTSHYAFDKFGMLTVPSDQSWQKRSLWKRLWDWILKRDWQPMWSDKSWRDSIGRTVLSWIAYDRTSELTISIYSCFEDGKLYRHPDHDELSSRDHWSYFIIFRYFYWGEVSFQNFIKKAPGMRGMNLWMKALAGNKKSEFWYYFWSIPFARFGNWWLKKCRKWGNIGLERDNDWWIKESGIKIETWTANGIYHEFDGFGYNEGYFVKHNRTTRQKLWAWIIFQTIPAYPLHNKGWQLYVMPESKKKEKLKRILLKRVAPRNLMLRLLFGDKTVTQQEINNYPPMSGYSPSAYMDETCRRDIHELTPKEAAWNMYEVDLIKLLWNGIE